MSLQENDLFDGVRDKVKIAIERLQYFAPKDGSPIIVAYSGGKDSIVVKDLVIKSGVKFDIHMNLTTVDAPELIQYCRKNHPDVEEHKAKTNMRNLIIEHRMMPTRNGRFCCLQLKETGGKGRNVVTGVRWEESQRRKSRRMFEVKRTDKLTFFLHPIIDWSSAEIWEYIKANNLPYCSLYDEGWKRIGCVGCPNADRKAQFKRWPRFERMYRAAAAAAAVWNIESLGKEYGGKDKPRMKRFTNGDEMFNWWINEPETEDPNQTCMIFE